MTLRALVKSALCDKCGKEIHFVDGERVTSDELFAMEGVHVCYERDRHWIEAITHRLPGWRHTEWTGDRHQRIYKGGSGESDGPIGPSDMGRSALPLPLEGVH